MIHKLTELISCIRTGRKWLLIAAASTVITSCWEKNYDYYYSVHFKNGTPDTLLLLLGTDTANYEHLDSFFITPKSYIIFQDFGVDGVSKDEDIRVKIFNGGYRPFEEQTRVYRNDSLKVTWDGPARDMPDSIHHFYNYNSWESWLVDDNEGIVMFTIYEADLY